MTHALAPELVAETTVALQVGGVWQPIITWMQIIVGGAATLTIIAGATIWATSPYDEEKVAIGKEMIGAAIAGLLIALLAVPAYKLLDGWMTPDDQGSAPSALVQQAHIAQPPSEQPEVVAAAPEDGTRREPEGA